MKNVSIYQKLGNVLKSAFISSNRNASMPVVPDSSGSGSLYDQLTTRSNVRRELGFKDLTVALRSAESWQNMDRYRLWQVYQQALMDTHLTSVIEKRIGRIKEQSFVLNVNGNEWADGQAIIQKVWFDQLIEAIMWSKLEGHVLVEFGPLTAENVPERVYKYDMYYYNPVEGAVYPDGWRAGTGSGIKYRGMPNIMEFGNPYDLGVLHKAADWTIAKRRAMTRWAQHTDRYAYPWLVMYSDGRDRQEMVDEAYEARGGSVFALDNGEKMELLDPKTDNPDWYQTQIDVSNRELSKLILGETMTTEQAGSHAQAVVHKQVSDEIEALDLRTMERTMNDKVFPFLTGIGVVPKGTTLTYLRHRQYELNQLQQIPEQAQDYVDWRGLLGEFGIPLRTDEQTQQAKAERLQRQSPNFHEG